MARPASAAVRLLTGEREPCRLATTANIALTGLQTIDGTLTEVGDRVLVKNQTDQTTNGIYTASAGAWYRASDARTARTMQKGTTVHVQQGTVGAGTVWAFQTFEPNIGTDNILITFYISDDIAADAGAVFDTQAAEAIAIFTAQLAAAQTYLFNLIAISESAASSLDEMAYPTKAVAELASPLTSFIRIRGIATEGDYQGIDAGWKYTASTPSHDLYITTANGRKYARVPAGPKCPVSVTEIGLLPNQGIGVDCTPAFNKMLVAAANSGCKSWFFPGAGGYYFNTRPNDITVSSIEFTGDAADTETNLFKNFVSAGTADGIFNFRRSNFKIKDLRFVGLEGSQRVIDHVGTGCYISVVAQLAGNAIGYGEIADIECTADTSIPFGTGCSSVCIYLDGEDNGGSVFPWVRGIKMTGLKMFGADHATIWAHCTAGCSMSGSGTFQAGGATGRMIIDGTALVPTAELQANFAVVSNGILFGYASSVLVTAGEFGGTGLGGGAAISFASSTLGCLTIGRMANGATMTNLGTNCAHIDPAQPQIVETGNNANGWWRKFSNGRIEQWGPCATSGGTGTLTFAKAFASAVHSLQVSSKDDPSANNVHCVQPHTISLSGASLAARVLTSTPGSAAASIAMTYYASGI